jgi:hypothetical protein
VCQNLGLIHGPARAFHADFTPASQIASTFFDGIQPQQEQAMDTSRTFRITLTPEQKEQVRQATGKEAEVVELSIEELEERIAPMKARIHT